MKKKKTNRGGVRDGSGRKKANYEYIQPGISTGVLVVISGIPEKKKPRNKGIW